MLYYTLVFFFFFTLVSANNETAKNDLDAHGTGDCPTFEEGHCHCTQGTKSTGINLICSFTDVENIKKSFKICSGRKIESLHLAHNIIHKLGPDFFAGLQINSLLLRYNRIKTIHEDAFSGLENSLTNLSIDEFYWFSFHFQAFNSIPEGTLGRLTNLKSLHILTGHIKNFTYSIFKNLHYLEVLSVKGYKLEKFADDTFSDMINLKSLEIKSSTMNAIPIKAFSSFKIYNKLEEIKVESSKIENIEAKSFSSFPNLKKIDLSSCNIKGIVDEAFLGLENTLKVLNLQRNNLILVPKAVKSLKSLEELDLGFNDINTLVDHSFTGMQLKNLTLDMIGLIKIEEKAFESLENSLEELNLEHNRLSYFPSTSIAYLVHLKRLFLSSNLIMTILWDAGTSLKQLEILDLSRNRIRKIAGNSFDAAKSTLSKLDLKMNLLIDYPQEFGKFENIKILDLSHNKIQNITVKSLEGSQDRLEYIGLEGNIWQCDCVMGQFRIWLVNWLAGLSHSSKFKMEKVLDNAKCVGPTSMKDIPIGYPDINHLFCSNDTHVRFFIPTYNETEKSSQKSQKMSEGKSAKVISVISLLISLSLLSFLILYVISLYMRKRKKLLPEDKQNITQFAYTMPLDNFE